MIIVATTTNESPGLNMKNLMPSDRVEKNADWFPIFKRNCKSLLIHGENWHSLVHIRGALFETASKMEEILVSGARCPIHETKRVCKLGNKTIVDLVLAIDPTLVDRREEAWICDVNFPVGFTPMCYASKKSSLQYLAIVFENIGVLAVDITPVSYTLLWDIAEKCRVLINSNVIAEGQYHKIEVLNAEPETVHKISIVSEVSDKFAFVSVQTPKITESSMDKFYKSRRRNDFYDLEGVNHQTVKYLRNKNIMKSGQKVNITPTQAQKSTMLNVVVSGDTAQLEEGNNMYVVPDFSTDSKQFICVEDKLQVSHVIEFDKSESFVKYNEQVYPHGSVFSIHEQPIEVVSGSIILVVGSTNVFPGGNEYASQILTSGDLVVRDLIMRSSYQVTEKVDGDTTYGKNSFFVYDPTANTTKEVSRISHGLDDAGSSGSVDVKLLYTDSAGSESFVNTLVSQASSTTITARDETEEISATFNSGGLSFDSDNGNIYFGADKDFRIHYAEASGLDPAMLQIQSLDGTDYYTRFLITAAPP